MPLKSLTDGLADLPRSTEDARDANLIRATTDLYVQDPVHDRDESRRFEELATHFLPRISITDRAYVSERLADRLDAPPSVMRMLARDAIDVAAPVLSSSPVLDSLALLSTIAATGAEHHRIIARRKDLPDQVRRALRLTGDAEVLHLIDGAVTPPAVVAPDPISFDIFRHGATALREAHRDGQRFLQLSRRDRLAVLVDHATRPPTPPSAGSTTKRLDRAFRSILGAAKIVGFARTGQRAQLIAAIADGLDITADFVAACLDDATGEALAILLKSLRLDAVQAQQVFLLMSPSGRDTNLFFPLADLYAGMEASIAEAICETWRATAAGHKSGYESYVAGEDTSRTGAVQQTRTAPDVGRKNEAKRA
jgi:uncharacterized protein (DUF2336 family)